MKAGARGDILDVRTWKTQKWWAVAAFDLWLSIYWGSQRRSVQPDNPRGAFRGGSLSSSASGIYGVGIFHGAIFVSRVVGQYLLTNWRPKGAWSEIFLLSSFRTLCQKYMYNIEEERTVRRGKRRRPLPSVTSSRQYHIAPPAETFPRMKCSYRSRQVQSPGGSGRRGGGERLKKR